VGRAASPVEEPHGEMPEREGLLAAAPLVLRFAPDRRSCAASSTIGDFVEPSMDFCPPGRTLINQ
jgi:hypothetical protein